MSHNPRELLWLVRPSGLPLIRRRCLSCPSALFRAYGKFRVNANHKLLDVWLLALCAGCGETIKLTVLERVHVRAVDPAALAGFHGNDLDVAAKVLREPGLLRRNRVTLDWDGAWTLEKTPPGGRDAEVADVSVRFAQRIPLRRTKLLSAGLEVSRSHVQRMIADGTLSSAHRLTATSSSDFSFTLKRAAVVDGLCEHRAGDDRIDLHRVRHPRGSGGVADL